MKNVFVFLFVFFKMRGEAVVVKEAKLRWETTFSFNVQVTYIFHFFKIKQFIDMTGPKNLIVHLE